MEYRKFAVNGVISQRQFKRLLFFDLFGISSLFLPSGLAKVAGEKSIYSIIIGGIASILFWWMILGKQTGQKNGENGGFGQGVDTRNIPNNKQSGKTKRYRNLGNFLVGMGMTFLSGILIILFSRFLQYGLLQEKNVIGIALGLLLLVFYAVFCGLEVRARVYEVMFWPLLLPFALMCILSLRDVKIETVVLLFKEMISFEEKSAGEILYGSVIVFLFYFATVMVLFVRPFVSEQNLSDTANAKQHPAYPTLQKPTVLVIGQTILFLLVEQMILLLNFGARSLSVLSYPIVTMMSIIRIPGGFLNRQETLMIGVWFFMLFAILCGMCVFGIDRLQRVTNRKRAFLLGLVFLVTGSSFFLSGCSTKELENRNFPMIMGVDKKDDGYQITYEFQNLETVADQNVKNKNKMSFFVEGESLEKCFLLQEKQSSRMIDFNHLKVIVLSEEFMQSEEYEDFLSLCQKKEILGRNVYMFLSDTPDEIVNAKQYLGENPGNYLEELMEKKENKEQIVMLGDLCNDYYNKTTTRVIPRVELVDEFLVLIEQ